MTEPNEALPLPIAAAESMAPGATVKTDVLAIFVHRVDALAERCGGQSRFAILNAIVLLGLMAAERALPKEKS